VEVEDVGFAWQNVILDADSEHRIEVAPENAGRDVVGQLVRCAMARFQLVQSPGAKLQPRGILFVEFADARIEIPADVVEPAVDRL